MGDGKGARRMRRKGVASERASDQYRAGRTGGTVLRTCTCPPLLFLALLSLSPVKTRSSGQFRTNICVPIGFPLALLTLKAGGKIKITRNKIKIKTG